MHFRDTTLSVIVVSIIIAKRIVHIIFSVVVNYQCADRFKTRADATEKKLAVESGDHVTLHLHEYTWSQPRADRSTHYILFQSTSSVKCARFDYGLIYV